MAGQSRRQPEGRGTAVAPALLILHVGLGRGRWPERLPVDPINDRSDQIRILLIDEMLKTRQQHHKTVAIVSDHYLIIFNPKIVERIVSHCNLFLPLGAVYPRRRMMIISQ